MEYTKDHHGDAVAVVQGQLSTRLRPHWRRDHFKRIHFGEKLSETRLGWIQPYLVHKDQAFGTVKTKEYVVR